MNKETLELANQLGYISDHFSEIKAMQQSDYTKDKTTAYRYLLHLSEAMQDQMAQMIGGDNSIPVKCFPDYAAFHEITLNPGQKLILFNGEIPWYIRLLKKICILKAVGIQSWGRQIVSKEDLSVCLTYKSWKKIASVMAQEVMKDERDSNGTKREIGNCPSGSTTA